MRQLIFRRLRTLDDYSNRTYLHKVVPNCWFCDERLFVVSMPLDAFTKIPGVRVFHHDAQDRYMRRVGEETFLQKPWNTQMRILKQIAFKSINLFVIHKFYGCSWNIGTSWISFAIITSLSIWYPECALVSLEANDIDVTAILEDFDFVHGLFTFSLRNIIAHFQLLDNVFPMASNGLDKPGIAECSWSK